jgi:hypothetical protein
MRSNRLALILWIDMLTREVTMLLGFLNSKPLLDEDSTLWLFDAFAWSLRNFDAAVFSRETRLILPTNQFFPGRESNAHGMANLILEKVKIHAGLNHWPCRAVDANTVSEIPIPSMIKDPLRGSKCVAIEPAEERDKLIIPYHPSQLGKPQGLIASYAHLLARYLAQTAMELPPGGERFLPQATELLAVFMGFGIMIANSAYTFRGACGSCYNPLAERAASLSQDEATYALAIFCALKKIPDKEVLPHLKNYLRPVFKKAVKEIREKRPEELSRLIAYHHEAGTGQGND